MPVKTDYRKLKLKCYEDLSDKHKSDFDYIEEDEYLSPRFVKYMGSIYDIYEFERIENKYWHAATPQTAFSGVLVRLLDDEGDNDHVRMGYDYQ